MSYDKVDAWPTWKGERKKSSSETLRKQPVNTAETSLKSPASDVVVPSYTCPGKTETRPVVSQKSATQKQESRKSVFTNTTSLSKSSSKQIPPLRRNPSQVQDSGFESETVPEMSPAVGKTSAYKQDLLNSYNMGHKRRGKFIVVNNKIFSRELCGQGMGERRGTDLDAANLFGTFKHLGFDVELKHNLTASDMLKLVITEAGADHSDADCFGMAILSHGEDGVVYGTDEMIRIDNLISPFKGNKCKTLLGKPKLFFFQACRGNELDEGADLPRAECEADDEVDGPNDKTYTIPIEADFLYAYSTPPGHYAFRHALKGGWFVQAITKVFKEFGLHLEINQLMIRVNRMVAYDFTSASTVLEHSNKKQVSSIVSMLTKELYFLPKKDK